MTCRDPYFSYNSMWAIHEMSLVSRSPDGEHAYLKSLFCYTCYGTLARLASCWVLHTTATPHLSGPIDRGILNTFWVRDLHLELPHWIKHFGQIFLRRSWSFLLQDSPRPLQMTDTVGLGSKYIAFPGFEGKLWLNKFAQSTMGIHNSHNQKNQSYDNTWLNWH